MCGIAGVLRVHEAGADVPPHRDAIPESWLDVLDESIKHRGPDGAGRFRDRAVRPDGTVVDVALVHRRLSIIDHEGGHQPMVHARAADESDLVAVAFNGCIYNHRELREELETLGHRFHTDHSDTEVLIHGWREWDLALPDRLNAMFAFALWDRAAADLYIARDRFGERPLSIAQFENNSPSSFTVAFASCPAALARWSVASTPRGSRPLELSAIGTAHWITYGCSDIYEPFMHTGCLPANAAGLLIDDAQHPDRSERRAERARRSLPKPPRLIRSTRLRSFNLERSRRASLRRPIAELTPILRDAVERRLDADVPVACLLSGGIDSSLVAAFASEAAGPIDTVCVRMPDARYDESPIAQAVADHLGTNHRTVDASADPAADLIHLIETLGLPFGDSSLLPTYWACLAASEVAPVLLTGDGGDEMFVGYDRHMVCRVRADAAIALGVLAWLVPTGAFPQRDPRARTTRLARLVRALRRVSYPTLTAIFEAPDAARLIGRAAEKPPLGVWPDGPTAAAEYDTRFTLPADYLRKVDTAALAVPVETRAPFLDHEVAQAAAELGSFRTIGGRKGLLRQLARNHLPDHVIDRPKQGFAIPIGDWFRTDYGGMRTLLHDQLLSSEPFPGLGEAGVEIDLGFVRTMLREHDAAGEASRNPWHGRDHSQRLYMLLVLSIWCGWLKRVRVTAADGF